jgi:hypothetical protein
LELPADSRLQAVVRKIQDGTAAYYGTPVDVDARSHFRVDGLTPGTYEILVSVLTTTAPDQPPIIPPARQTVVVTNGAVTDVTITLQMPQPRVLVQFEPGFKTPKAFANFSPVVGAKRQPWECK